MATRKVSYNPDVQNKNDNECVQSMMNNRTPIASGEDIKQDNAKKSKAIQFCVSVNAETKSKWKTYAAAKNMTVSTILKIAMEEYINNHR